MAKPTEPTFQAPAEPPAPAPAVTFDSPLPVTNAPALKPPPEVPQVIRDIVDAAKTDGFVKRVQLETEDHVKAFVKLARTYAQQIGAKIRIKIHDGNAVHLTVKTPPVEIVPNTGAQSPQA